MLRRPSTLAAAVSFVLCVATCVLWVRSHHWAWDCAWRGQPGPSTAPAAVISSANGTLWVVAAGPWPSAGPWQVVSEPARPPSAYHFGVGWPAPHAREAGVPGAYVLTGSGQLHLFGPGDRTLVETGPVATVYAVVSLWCPAAVTAFLPAVAGVRWLVRRGRQRRRRASNLCPACGYDLRATPGRCPECGAGPEGPDRL